MWPVRNVFQKLSRTEQRREGVVAYLCGSPFTVSEAVVLVRKLRQLLPRSAKLSGLTPGVSCCFVESAVSLPAAL